MYYIKNKWGDRYYSGFYNGKFTMCPYKKDAIYSDTWEYLQGVLETMCEYTGIKLSEFEIVWEEIHD